MFMDTTEHNPLLYLLHEGLRQAVIMGDIYAVEALLERGGDVNQDDTPCRWPTNVPTLLEVAVWAGHHNLILFLLNRGATITGIGSRIFKSALLGSQDLAMICFCSICLAWYRESPNPTDFSSSPKQFTSTKPILLLL